MYEDFPEDQPNGPQDAIANPQTHVIQDAGLRIAKATDHRDFDDWTADESFCQRFLTDRSREWRTAIQQYWRERCTRRELATELGLSLETVKNLLRRIRKAAKDFQSGKKRRHALEIQWPRRPHTEINERDILAICDGDPEAREHAEEYRRLTIINQLSLFAPAISGQLVTIFEHSVGRTGCETASLIAEADGLKASAARDDPFPGRAMFQSFTNARTEYADRRGRPSKIVHHPIVPIPIFLDQRSSQQLEEPMQYQQASEIIKNHDIPRSTVARLSGMYLSDLSGWLNGRTDLAQDKIERISIVVADVAKMIQAMATLSIKVDLSDVENVRLLVQKINDAEMQMDLLSGPESLGKAAAD